METEALARRLVEIADEKQASDLVALDMRGLVSYTDFLVVATARNERQAKAIVDEVRERLKREDDITAIRVEGEARANWVLLDYLDCVLHVFTPDATSTGSTRFGGRRRDWRWRSASRLGVRRPRADAPG
jgi:ribosome-associated protein